ncbi:unnamed protein product [Caenorhabditis brenneri]
MDAIVQIFWNLNHTIFPWSVILFHRGLRINLKKAFCSESQVNTSGMTSFDGQRIVPNPTQNECFEQMKAAWTQEKF